MVKAACAKYGNVSVVSSGSYMISSATFPSYFLKDADVVTRTHAELDATLFTRIAAALNLTRRYVGEEPFSHTTSLYNEALAAVLPKAGVELVVIPRAQAQGEAISASHVRQLIHDGHIEAIRPLVPGDDLRLSDRRCGAGCPPADSGRGGRDPSLSFLRAV